MKQATKQDASQSGIVIGGRYIFTHNNPKAKDPTDGMTVIATGFDDAYVVTSLANGTRSGLALPSELSAVIS